MAEPTYTYEGRSASDKDRLRFDIQDIGPTKWQFSDQDLQSLIDDYGLEDATLEAVDILVRRYARLKDEKTDKVEVKWSQLYDHYKELYDRLESDRSRIAIPWVGGISREDKRDRDADDIGTWAKINAEDPEDISTGTGDCL